MVKRLMSCQTSDFEKMTAEDLKQAVKANDGRTILAECLGAISSPYSRSLTNAEVAKSVGADLILLNGFNAFRPLIMGLPGVTLNEVLIDRSYTKYDAPLKKLKELVGRPIGVNLEPIDLEAAMNNERNQVSLGQTCTKETLEKAEAAGANFICLTGNPGSGVTTKSIAASIRISKQHFSGLIFAGKMHSSGSAEPVVTQAAVEAYAEAGVDVLLLPSIGTVPGFSEEDMKQAVDYAKAKGILTMSTIGTSQETSSNNVIEQIALKNKIAGVDIQHIGDAGMFGSAPVEAIFALSSAIRGKKHTINMIARSIKR